MERKLDTWKKRREFSENYVKRPLSVPSDYQVPSHAFPIRPVCRSPDPEVYHSAPRPPEGDRLTNPDSVSSDSHCTPKRISTDIGSEVTHIYLQRPGMPSMPKQNGVHCDKLETDEENVPKMIPKDFISDVDNRYQYSRMSRFRRSLISGDFLKRRKKKDHRRNTVSTGDDKDIKEALRDIINEDSRHATIRNGKGQLQKMIPKTLEKSIIYEQSVQNSFKNDKVPNIVISNAYQKNLISGSNEVFRKLDRNNCGQNALRKHPLYNEAVEDNTVQLNVIEMQRLYRQELEDQSSNGSCGYNSDINSSDSDNRVEPYEISQRSTEQNMIASKMFSNELKENIYKMENSKINCQTRESTTDESNYDSSENVTSNSQASNTISSVSDSCFVSSDESDGELSDSIEFNYRSFTSLSTASNGSLNSLLSETGTQMGSSTGTLTSIGIDQHPTPPPSVLTAVFEKQIRTKSSNLDFQSISSEKEEKPKSTPVRSESKQKPKKAKKPETKKSVLNTKCMLSNLMKPKTKTGIISKDSELLEQKTKNRLQFDVYGNSSPKLKEPPSFIKENSDFNGIAEKDSKCQLRSFSLHYRKPENGEKHKEKYSASFSDNQQLNKRLESCVPIKFQNNYLQETNAEIPLKYTQSLTVTPIQRQKINEQINAQDSCPFISKSGNDRSQNLRNTAVPSQICDKNKSPNHTEVMNVKVESKPQRPLTLTRTTTRPAARVVLDPEGRVIYSTNSLDRKFGNITSSSYIRPNQRHENFIHTNSGQVLRNNDSFYRTYAQHETRQNANVTSPEDSPCKETNYIITNNKKPTAQSGSKYNAKNHTDSNCGLPTFQTANENLNGFLENKVNPYDRERPNEDITIFNNYSIPHLNIGQSHVYKRMPERVSQHFTPTAKADPNISGLPEKETMYLKCNINSESKRLDQLGISPVNQNNATTVKNCFDQTAPFQNALRDTLNKSPQSTMSTEDLFAFIHTCKKRMNIKTESDLPTPSVPFSPNSQLSPSKGVLAETGFLSPRYNPGDRAHLPSGDRRSWAGTTTNERKYLASDRMGPSKPTSMHDFKVLLSQAKCNNQSPGPRKSAVEMLKLPTTATAQPPDGHSLNSSRERANLSHRNSISFLNHQSPDSQVQLRQVHSTVPLKRNRTRASSLHLRYTMYPPIFEECAEDSDFKEKTQNHVSLSNLKSELQIKNEDKREKEDNVENTEIQKPGCWF